MDGAFNLSIIVTNLEIRANNKKVVFFSASSARAARRFRTYYNVFYVS